MKIKREDYEYRPNPKFTSETKDTEPFGWYVPKDYDGPLPPLVSEEDEEPR